MNNGIQAHEMTFEQFASQATVTPLVNHGRAWEVKLEGRYSSFADGPTAVDALRDTHSGAVNNALYFNTPDDPSSHGLVIKLQRRLYTHRGVLRGRGASTVKFSFPTGLFETRGLSTPSPSTAPASNALPSPNSGIGGRGEEQVAVTYMNDTGDTCLQP